MKGKRQEWSPQLKQSTNRVLRAGAQEKLEVAQRGALGTEASDARSV